MVAIPDNMLNIIGNNPKASDSWVYENVTVYFMSISSSEKDSPLS
jgi:hypothetical protein